jgi:hypothetical protein
MAPKSALPAYVARDVFRVERETLQHEPRRLHNVAAYAVARQPRYAIFGYRTSLTDLP